MTDKTRSARRVIEARRLQAELGGIDILAALEELQRLRPQLAHAKQALRAIIDEDREHATRIAKETLEDLT